FNGTFHETAGGLYAIAVRSPVWVRVLAPGFGALAAGLIVRYVSPESGGHGVVEVIEAIHGRGRELRGRIAVWKSLAAGLVIGSGGSAGKEGPVVHLGGAVAASLGRLLALPRCESAVLLGCGAGMLYIRAVHGAEELFSGRAGGRFGAGLSQLRPEWRAAAGGFAVGLLALLAPRILGTGIETMNAALAGELAFGALVLTFTLKLAGTAATLGSGSPGGSFFPAAFH